MEIEIYYNATRGWSFAGHTNIIFQYQYYVPGIRRFTATAAVPPGVMLTSMYVPVQLRQGHQLTLTWVKAGGRFSLKPQQISNHNRNRSAVHTLSSHPLFTPSTSPRGQATLIFNLSEGTAHSRAPIQPQYLGYGTSTLTRALRMPVAMAVRRQLLSAPPLRCTQPCHRGGSGGGPTDPAVPDPQRIEGEEDQAAGINPKPWGVISPHTPHSNPQLRCAQPCQRIGGGRGAIELPTLPEPTRRRGGPDGQPGSLHVPVLWACLGLLPGPASPPALPSPTSPQGPWRSFIPGPASPLALPSPQGSGPGMGPLRRACMGHRIATRLAGNSGQLCDSDGRATPIRGGP